jgi:hypothetical protein
VSGLASPAVNRLGVLLMITLGLSAPFIGCVRATCGEDSVPVVSPDGGSHRCVLPEDCPRPGSVLLCETDADEPRECVRCLDTVCVRDVPRTCP